MGLVGSEMCIRDSHIFPTLTVRENLRTGLVKGEGKADEQLEQIFMYFPVLKERLHQLGGTLSGGEQQMLAISRALLGNPKLIMLDEPSEGLMPSMVALVRDTVKRICDTGVSVILVEQNVKMALAIAHRVYIMQKGVVSYTGQVQECTDEVLLQHLGV